MTSVDHPLKARQLICSDCQNRLVLLQNPCPTCALPLSGQTSSRCGNCLKMSPPYRKTVSAFHYEPPVSEFISEIKFNGRRQLLPRLVDFLNDAIETSYTQESLPDELIPVPLFRKKLKQRGFNQAELIAKRLGKHFKLPLNTHCVLRNRSTKTQVGLKATDRIRNLAGAFEVKFPPASHVAIIDDVMTTGSTVSAMAEALLKSGAERVDVWCLARAYSI